MLPVMVTVLSAAEAVGASSSTEERVTEVSAVQSSKAYLPMAVMGASMVTEVTFTA